MLKPKRDETATLPISSDQRLPGPWTAAEVNISDTEIDNSC